MSAAVVAVFVAQSQAADVRLPSLDDRKLTFVAIALPNCLRSTRGIVAAAVTKFSRPYCCYFNAVSSIRDGDRDVWEAVNAELSRHSVPIASTQPRHCRWNGSEQRMQLYYSGMTLMPFRTIAFPAYAAAATASPLMPDLALPVVVRSSATGDIAATCANDAALREAVSASLDREPDVIVEETTSAHNVMISALVCGGPPGGGAHVLPLVLGGTTNGAKGRAVASHAARVSEWCRKFFDTALEGKGLALLRFEVRGAGVGDDAAAGDLVVVDVNMAPPVFVRPRDAATSGTSAAVADLTWESLDIMEAMEEVSFADWAAEVVANCLRQFHPPTFKIGFDPKAKGYFVRAARSLRSGDVVFHDEGRAFPIVTKPFVDANWSKADQETFSRYAWPIDSAGHVYAIWENEPKTWRPINHSCHPNLAFAAPHSLNVIARRDIADNEDLTLDYATFCDLTMQPFDCFCGTPQCRGKIVPNDGVLKGYGGCAWHRGGVSR